MFWLGVFLQKNILTRLLFRDFVSSHQHAVCCCFPVLIVLAVSSWLSFHLITAPANSTNLLVITHAKIPIQTFSYLLPFANETVIVVGMKTASGKI